MIDFRYHLVSIISIFLALAVGIVLGAGPLKGSIGDTLTQELANARKDKADLNAELLAAQRRRAAADQFAKAALPKVVAGTLTDKKVLLVVGPKAPDAAVKAVTEAVTSAGGAVTKTITVQPALLETRSAQARQQALARLAPAVHASAVTETELAGAVIGRSLLAGPATAPYSPAAGTTVMAGLVTAGLVKTSDPQLGTEAQPVPTLAVVVAGPVATDSTAETTAQTEAYLGLVRGIDTAATGTVLVCAEGAPAPGTAAAVVTSARSSNPTSERVSTVDDVDQPMGQAALVLALRASQDGAVGRYGTAEDAQAPLPPSPTGSAAPSAGAT